MLVVVVTYSSPKKDDNDIIYFHSPHRERGERRCQNEGQVFCTRIKAIPIRFSKRRC